MEISDYLTLTPEQKSKRKEKWKEKQKDLEAGRDYEKIRAAERAKKCLFLLKKDYDEGLKLLNEAERITLCGIVVKYCTDDFYFFCKEVVGMDLFTEETHRIWCEDLIHALKNKKKRLMRLKARGTFKTSLYGVCFILWLWGCQSTEIKIFYTSSNALLLNEVADKLNIYIGNKKNDTFFSHIFGIIKDEDSKNTTDVINIKGRSSKGFSLILRTAGGSSVGIHPNIIICDDVVGENDRDSKATRDQKERWFEALTPLIVPFYNPATGIDLETILYIGTRWHLKDLVNYIMEKNKKYTDRNKWDIESEGVLLDDGSPRYPEFFPMEKILGLQSEMDEVAFSCNPADTPILMADFTTKNIQDLEIGDKVIGFTLGDTHQGKSRIVVTEVQATGNRMADVVKITLESGRVIRCTPDHKWYNGRGKNDLSHSPYSIAKVGRNLLRVVDCHYKPTFEELLDWRYLGGMIDGEGSCKHGQCVLHQSITKNPEVHKNICEVLKRLNIPYSLYPHSKKRHCDMFYLSGGRDIKAKIIRYGNCAKKGQILDGLLNIKNRTVVTDKSHLKSKHLPVMTPTNKGRDKIISIEPDGHEMVYSFQTGTGNYVAWGYASKNCHYLNNPLPEGLQIFDLDRLHFVREDQIQEAKEKGEWLCVFDPALGKSAGDYPAVWHVIKYNDNLIFYDAIDKKTELSLLFFQIANKNKEYGCRRMRFENNNAMLIEDKLREAHKVIDWKIHIDSIRNTSNKEERIISCQPYLYSGYVQFMDDYLTRYPEAMNQIVFFGAYGHDDFPDAMALAITFYQQKHFKFVAYTECL